MHLCPQCNGPVGTDVLCRIQDGQSATCRFCGARLPRDINAMYSETNTEARLQDFVSRASSQKKWWQFWK
jgi:transcription elongation factor Elf1